MNNLENKIEEILQKLTLEEKVAMCHANSTFASNGVPRLNIDELTMADGPHGVRPETRRDGWGYIDEYPENECTYLPTATALASTFNPQLARIFGETLGSEARYRNKDIILGPGVNIIRTPLCGRNFEYFSEDPCLIQKLAPDLVKGIESQDTAACVKHYALNNHEWGRSRVNADVSRRALYEIYLKGFYSAIIEGGASSVMGSYNKYQNQHCCHNDYLVNKVLKGKWGFDGVFLTDWGGCHDTDEAIYNGLDIEMGSGQDYSKYYLSDAFLEKCKNNPETVEILNDKVRRILRLMLKIRKLDSDRNKGEFNTKQHQKNAYDVAAEAMVLLKNDASILPINKDKLKKILVMGPNADLKHSKGGCSSGVYALYEITPLKGIIDRFSSLCEIEYESGQSKVEYTTIPLQNLNIIDYVAGCSNYKIISNVIDETGKNLTEVNFADNANIIAGNGNKYEIHFSINVPENGIYSFQVCTNASAKIMFNNKECLTFFELGWEQNGNFSLDFNSGDRVDVDIVIEPLTMEKTLDKGTIFTFGWITPSDYSKCTNEEILLKKANEADYVVYCGGINHSYDTESVDKKSMLLPSGQDSFIPKLLNANENTIIVLTAGSPVELPWIDKAKTVIWNWYAGMEGGNVLADILLGKINPSGKLPFTLPKKYEDCPVARYGEYNDGNCKYNEDVLVGYRAYDYDNIEPMFPFGHGLSYTEFEYSDLKISPTDDGMTVSFKVTNIGKTIGKETAQVYISDPVCSVLRPPKELKTFKKVELAPNESTEIILDIPQIELCYYDEKIEDWKFENGEFLVLVGSSSRDIRLTGSIIL